MIKSFLPTARLARVFQPLTGRAGGQGMVEYALILMLVALVVIFMITVLGHKVNNAFSNVSNSLTN